MILLFVFHCVILASPWLSGLIILRLIFTGQYKVLLWWLLPWGIAVLALWLCCLCYGVTFNFSSVLYLTTPAILSAGLLFWLLRNAAKPGAVICAHLSGVAVFVLFQSLAPGASVFSELVEAREQSVAMRQLRQLDQASDDVKARLQDEDFRQQALAWSAAAPDMPASTFQALISSGANPFKAGWYKMYPQDASSFSMHSPLSYAVRNNNLTAVRMFSEMLADNAPGSADYRARVQHDNPLRFDIHLSTAAKTDRIAMMKTLLHRMPALLDDNVYEGFVSEGDAESLRFLWGIAPPENPALREQAQTLINTIKDGT